METLALDIRSLIHDQVKDDKGKTLPPDSKSGQASWFTLERNGRGRVLQSNRNLGEARSFSCEVPFVLCEDRDADLTVEDPTLNVGDSPLFASAAAVTCTVPEAGDCYGDFNGETTTHVNFLWSSFNSSIAAIDGANNQADVYVLGRSGGVTGIDVLITQPDNGNCNQSGSANAYVYPIVTSVTPPRGLIATNVPVTIMGAGFTGATLSAGTGIASTINNRTDTQIDATFFIASDAPSGDHAVYVTQNGVTSNSATFRVQIPSQLTIQDLPPAVLVNNGNVLDYYGNISEQHECGIYRNVQYNLIDQAGGDIVGGDFDITENFGNYSTSNPNTAVPGSRTFPQNTSIQLLADGQVYVSPSPICPGANDHEGFDQSFVITVPSGSTYHYALSTVIRIDRGGYAGTGKVDISVKTP